MSLRAYLLIFIILLVDQVSKLYVKCNFILGEELKYFDTKYYLSKTKENGMGYKIPGAYGKLFLTLFRVCAVGGIGYWLWDATGRQKSSNFLVVSIAFDFLQGVG
jgi:signal peptidase II